MGFLEDEELEMGDEMLNLNYFEWKKLICYRNWVFVSVFLFLVKGINKVKLKGKSYLMCLFGLKYRWYDFYGSMISGDDVDFLDYVESKIFENFESEILLDFNEVDVKLYDICVLN